MNVVLKDGTLVGLYKYLFKQYVANEALHDDLNGEREMVYVAFLSLEGIWGKPSRASDWSQVRAKALEFKKKLPKELRFRVFGNKKIILFNEDVALNMWLENKVKDNRN